MQKQAKEISFVVCAFVGMEQAPNQPRGVWYCVIGDVGRKELAIENPVEIVRPSCKRMVLLASIRVEGL